MSDRYSVSFGCLNRFIYRLHLFAFEQIIDAFELWCWRRLLRVPWTAMRSNLLILKEINVEYSLEGLMLKLKLQYFGHLMWRTDSFEKTLMLGKIVDGGEGDDRGWDGWMASLTRWLWVWTSPRSWWWTGKPGMLQSMGSQKVRHDWVTQLTDSLSILTKCKCVLFRFKQEINQTCYFPLSWGQSLKIWSPFIRLF